MESEKRRRNREKMWSRNEITTSARKFYRMKDERKVNEIGRKIDLDFIRGLKMKRKWKNSEIEME